VFEIFLGIALIVFASKVGPAMAQRISGQAMDAQVAQRMRELEERLEQMDERVLSLASDNHERLVDIEERVDFAERVLQQQRSAQLPPQGN
jgi:glycine/serine hydroxymethyltransferase